MQRTINHTIFVLFSAVILTSCNNSTSLQRYFVDNQEATSFISQDIPISIVEIDKTEFTEEQLEAYNSVKRLNFLGYKANETNAETLNIELIKVKEILNDSKYNDLIEFSDKGNKVSVKYIGDDNEADEVVIFGNSKELGFGIVRVLGDNMSPDKMATLVSTLQSADFDKNQVQDIMNFFKPEFE